MITYVSMLYNIYDDHIGNFGNPERRIALLQKLFSSNIPLIFYTDSFYFDRITAIAPSHVKVIHYELYETVTYKRMLSNQYSLPSIHNPTKDTNVYMALMNAKTEFLGKAIRDGHITTPYVGYIDSGIAYIFHDIAGCFERIRTTPLDGLQKILMPGCWNPSYVPIMFSTIESLSEQVCWIFAGGIFLGPIDKILEFEARHSEALGRFLEAGRIVWEVNVWAYVEFMYPGNIQWYVGNHDDSMAYLPTSFEDSGKIEAESFPPPS